MPSYFVCLALSHRPHLTLFLLCSGSIRHHSVASPYHPNNLSPDDGSTGKIDTEKCLGRLFTSGSSKRCFVSRELYLCVKLVSGLTLSFYWLFKESGKSTTFFTGILLPGEGHSILPTGNGCYALQINLPLHRYNFSMGRLKRAQVQNYYFGHCFKSSLVFPSCSLMCWQIPIPKNEIPYKLFGAPLGATPFFLGILFTWRAFSSFYLFCFSSHVFQRILGIRRPVYSSLLDHLCRIFPSPQGIGPHDSIADSCPFLLLCILKVASPSFSYSDCHFGSDLPRRHSIYTFVYLFIAINSEVCRWNNLTLLLR